MDDLTQAVNEAGEPRRMLEQDEVLERLCILRDKVNLQVFLYKVTTDCFCKDAPSFEDSGEVLAYIEEAVDQAIKSYKRRGTSTGKRNKKIQ